MTQVECVCSRHGNLLRDKSMLWSQMAVCQGWLPQKFQARVSTIHGTTSSTAHTWLEFPLHTSSHFESEALITHACVAIVADPVGQITPCQHVWSPTHTHHNCYTKPQEIFQLQSCIQIYLSKVPNLCSNNLSWISQVCTIGSGKLEHLVKPFSWVISSCPSRLQNYKRYLSLHSKSQCGGYHAHRVVWQL